MVFLREEHRKATGMAIADVYLVLDELAALLRPVVPYFQWRPILPDPDDERVLEAAINGQADVLVTFNVRDYLPAAHKFNVAVLRPAELLRRL
jgi:predicted nucleic acid-binding protein